MNQKIKELFDSGLFKDKWLWVMVLTGGILCGWAKISDSFYETIVFLTIITIISRTIFLLRKENKEKSQEETTIKKLPNFSIIVFDSLSSLLLFFVLQWLSTNAKESNDIVFSVTFKIFSIIFLVLSFLLLAVWSFVKILEYYKNKETNNSQK